MPENSEASRCLYVAVVSCLVSPLLFGFSLGFTSPAQDTMRGNVDTMPEGDLVVFSKESKTQASIFASVITVGAMFGALSASRLSDRLGRKMTLAFTAVPYFIAYQGLFWTNNWMLLSLWRFVMGVSVGAGSAVAPTYIMEVSTPGLRGGLGAANQLSVTIGILVANVLGAYVFAVDGACQWRNLSLFGFGVALALTSTMLIPESPKFLMKRGRVEDAKAALNRLRRTREQAAAEHLELAAECTGAEDSGSAALVQGGSPADKTSIFAPQYRRALISGLGLLMFQQLNGANAIIFYTEAICRSAGMGEKAKLATLVITIMQVIMTALSCLVMDMLDRRVWLLIGCLLMAPSLFIISLYYWSTKHGDFDLPAEMAVGAIVIYIVGFSLGWGPIPWLVQPELFPMEVRGPGTSIAVGCNWTAAFAVTLGFQPLSSELGDDATFFMLGAICCVSASFVACYVPETRGKSPEQVLQELSQQVRRRPRGDARDVAVNVG